MRNENVEKILQMVDPVFLILLIQIKRKGKGTDWCIFGKYFFFFDCNLYLVYKNLIWAWMIFIIIFNNLFPYNSCSYFIYHLTVHFYITYVFRRNYPFLNIPRFYISDLKLFSIIIRKIFQLFEDEVRWISKRNTVIVSNSDHEIGGL